MINLKSLKKISKEAYSHAVKTIVRDYKGRWPGGYLPQDVFEKSIVIYSFISSLSLLETAEVTGDGVVVNSLRAHPRGEQLCSQLTGMDAYHEPTHLVFCNFLRQKIPPPYYFLSRDLFFDFEQSDPPKEIPLATDFVLPNQGVIFYPDGTSYVAYSVIPDEGDFIVLLHGYSFSSRRNVLSITSRSVKLKKDGEVLSVVPLEDPVELGVTLPDGSTRSIPPGDLPELSRFEFHLNILLSSICYAQSYEPSLKSAGRGRRAGFSSSSSQSIYSPAFIGGNYRSQGSNIRAGVHPSPRAHWRRGHWRMQPYGERASRRKPVFIQPQMIGVKL